MMIDLIMKAQSQCRRPTDEAAHSVWWGQRGQQAPRDVPIIPFAEVRTTKVLWV